MSVFKRALKPEQDENLFYYLGLKVKDQSEILFPKISKHYQAQKSETDDVMFVQRCV